jgi:hypothetical protein
VVLSRFSGHIEIGLKYGQEVCHGKNEEVQALQP